MEDHDMKKTYQAPFSEIEDISAEDLCLFISNATGKFDGGEIGDGNGDDFFPDPSANGSEWFDGTDPFFDA